MLLLPLQTLEGKRVFVDMADGLCNYLNYTGVLSAMDGEWICLTDIEGDQRPNTEYINTRFVVSIHKALGKATSDG